MITHTNDFAITSSTYEIATLLLNTIADAITPNDIHFVAVFFKLRINSDCLHRNVKWLHQNYHQLMLALHNVEILSNLHRKRFWYWHDQYLTPYWNPSSVFCEWYCPPEITIRFCLSPVKDLVKEKVTDLVAFT